MYNRVSLKKLGIERTVIMKTFMKRVIAVCLVASLAGLTFVVTGDLEHFANRKELQALIEKGGGKVTGSVTKKTNFLINNDIHSASSKNKKAAELGIPILSEQDFIEKFMK